MTNHIDCDSESKARDEGFMAGYEAALSHVIQGDPMVEGRPSLYANIRYATRRIDSLVRQAAKKAEAQ